MIPALCIISASEIAKVFPDFTYQWAEDNPHQFQDLLYEVGMDKNYKFEVQTDVQHKNRFGELVVCDRYVGIERTDREWLESGVASQEAKDRAASNKLLEDLYRRKGLYSSE